MTNNVASKRKKELRENTLFESGWFAISEDMWKDPGEVSSKLRFVSDVNFPSPLMDRIWKRGIEVMTAQELGFDKLTDDDLLAKGCAPSKYKMRGMQ